jgi:hypothetical protein
MSFSSGRAIERHVPGGNLAAFSRASLLSTPLFEALHLFKPVALLDHGAWCPFRFVTPF